jgi:hypothetical protein
MANQLNEMLKDRCLTGSEVKSKIGNLTTEYRRKKKDQGRTGASPSPWPYYELIDKLLGEITFLTFLGTSSFVGIFFQCKSKRNFSNLVINEILLYFMCIPFSLLGERPYMDDSLLSDSIMVEEEQILANIDQTSTPDLNRTQTSEQADDLNQLTSNSDEINNPAPVTSSSSSSSISIPKSDSPLQVISKAKKSGSAKKKRASEAK